MINDVTFTLFFTDSPRRRHIITTPTPTPTPTTAAAAAAILSIMHSVVAPKAFNSTSIKGQIHWLLITVVGYIIFAWVVVANLIPFFGELHGLMGALLGCPIVFGWPSPDSLLASKKKAGSRADTFSSIGFVNSSLLCLIDLSVYYLFYSLLVLYSRNMGWYCGHHPRYY